MSDDHSIDCTDLRLCKALECAHLIVCVCVRVSERPTRAALGHFNFCTFSPTANATYASLRRAEKGQTCQMRRRTK